MRLTDVLKGKGGEQEDKKAEQDPVAFAEWREDVQNVPLAMIVASPFQPRMEFQKEAIEELAASIREHGVLHPVVLRKKDDMFELVVGERRVRACKALGWSSVPAIVRELSDRAAAELALIENLQRRDLGFFEEAEGYRKLIEEFRLTQDVLAHRLGKSQSSIANKLRLLKLPQEVRRIATEQGLSERHMRALLRLPGKEEQLRVVKVVSERGLSVKDTEEMVAGLVEIKEKEVEKGGTVSKPKKVVLKDLKLFTNSLKQLTASLQASGLKVDVAEENATDQYRVTIVISRPGGRD